MADIKRVFKKDGTVVKLHTEYPVEELNSKDVLETLDKFKSDYQRSVDQRKQLDKQIEQTEKQIAHIQQLQKDLGKFESWAREVQESKIKAVLNEIKDEAIQAVRDHFVPEKEFDAEQNKKKMYLELQTTLSSHDKVRSAIEKSYIQKYIFLEPLIENPF